MTQFPGQQSMAVISIILVPPADYIGLAHKTNMAKTHKSHGRGGGYVIIIHLRRCRSKRVKYNYIESYSYLNIIEIRNM